MKLIKEMKIDVDVRVAAAVAAGLLGCGGLTGWLVCRSYMSRAFYGRLDQEMAALRLSLRNKYEKDAVMAKGVRLLEADELAATDHPASDLEDDDSGTDDSDQQDPEEGGDGPVSDDAEDDSGAAARVSADDDRGDGSPGPEDEPVAVLNRDNTKPYAISMVDFSNTDAEWQTLSLTWYEADGVLVDEKGEPVPNVLRTVGILNAAGFGGISGDPHIRLVRNEKLKADFEILLNEGSYADEVLNYGRPK